MKKYYDTIVNAQTGVAIPGAQVQVNLGASLATIYSDNGITPITNPVTTDANGFFQFYAADGRYNLSIYANGVLQKTINDVLIYDNTATTGASSVITTASDSVQAELNNATTQSNLKPQSIANIATLRLATSATLTNNSVNVIGYYTTAVNATPDGGGGILVYDSTDTTSSDNGGSIIVDASSRRWKWQDMFSINIKRFGAKGDGTTDDTTAIQNALNYAGTIFGSVHISTASVKYKITTTLTVPFGVSIYGDGEGSIIFASGCDGLTLGFDTASYEVSGLSRFIRDFQIIGNNATTSTNNGIVCNYSVASGHRVTGINFQNLVIKDFGTGVYARQLWNSNFDGVDILNSYYGIYFIGQNIKNSITNCFMQLYTMTGSGGSWGISFQTAAGESTQSTQIYGTQTYNFSIGINVLLAFETQIEHCDISVCSNKGINITSTIGGCWVRDCWIQTTNSAVTYGVYLAALGVPNNMDVHVIGNHIRCDNAFAGSTGIFVAAAQVAATINDNDIDGFDIGYQNNASANVTFKFNRINILTNVISGNSKAVLLNSSSTDNEVGPNTILYGDPNVNTSFYQATTMTNSSANIGVTDSTKFPVGSTVQFSATNNGFRAGVTYTVLTSSANVITVGANSTSSAISATGSTANNVLAAPYPLSFNTSTSPPGLTFFGRGSFIGSLTGFTTAVGGQVDWVASGKIISLNPNASGTWSGTSNSGAMNLTGMPDQILNPNNQQQVIVNVEDSGTFAYGVAIITTAAAIQMFKNAGGSGFTASGAKALNNQSPIMYQLN